MLNKNRIFSFLAASLILNLLTLSTSLALRSENNFADRAWAKNQSLLQVQRASQTYKHIYTICSQGLEFSKLQYVYDSALQVKEIFSFNEEAFQKIEYRHSLISPELSDDLNNPAFFLAMADCGFSEHDRNLFVANLLLLDVSGKLLAISGTFKIGQILGKAMTQLRARSPIAFWGISAAGVTQSAVQLWSKIYPESHASTMDNKQKKQVIDLTNEMNSFTDQAELQNQKIKSMLLAMYDQEIAQDYESLEQSPANSAVRSHLNALIQSRLELVASTAKAAINR